VISNLCHVASAFDHQSCRRLTYPRYPQESGPDDTSLVHGKVEGFSMSSKPKDATIDQIVASCDGDIHGALKALLLVNEHLEAELLHIYAVVACGERGNSVLH
jgi:hypothetical protein